MILLAQSSDLAGFFEQPFVSAALAMICFFGILLILVVAALVYVRRRKARAALAETPAPPAYYSESFESADMPDLDTLVSTAGFSTSRPAASPPDPVVPPRTARKGTFAVTPEDGDPTEAVEIMVVMRDLVDGHLIIQMGDKVYQNVARNAEFKERFTKLMRELGQGTTSTTTSPTPATPSINVAEQDDEEPASLSDLMQPDISNEPQTPSPKPKAPPPPVPSTGKMPGDLPSFKLADNPLEKRKRGQKQDIKPVPEVNIAGAIEAYLQYKLKNTPEFSGRSIHIYPAPDGGVSIEADGRYYDAVGDIEDEAVREFIATSIQEWQERH